MIVITNMLKIRILKDRKGHYTAHNIVLILSITYTQLSMSSCPQISTSVRVYHVTMCLNTTNCAIMHYVFKYCSGSLKTAVGRRNM